jgi:hypothetical protein
VVVHQVLADGVPVNEDALVEQIAFQKGLPPC